MKSIEPLEVRKSELTREKERETIKWKNNKQAIVAAKLKIEVVRNYK